MDQLFLLRWEARGRNGRMHRTILYKKESPQSREEVRLFSESEREVGK